jgi:phospholipase/carboxylesterase
MSMLSGPSASPAAGGPPRQLVVLLHGVGADGNDLINLSQPLSGALPHARFIAPNAPEPCDMAPMGYQWFSLQDRTPDVMMKGVRHTAPMVDAFIDAELAKDGLADQQLALIGFSQGTMMSLHVAPRRAKAMAGLLCFAGALLSGELLKEEAKSKPPVMLIHGEEDTVVPVQAMHAAAASLQTINISVQWMARPGLPHGIDPEGVAAGAAFLAQAFKDAEKASDA